MLFQFNVTCDITTERNYTGTKHETSGEQDKGIHACGVHPYF